MTAAGTFSIRKGAVDPAQPHLVLYGANGEPVVWSEPYASGDEGARNALEVIVRTVLETAKGYAYDTNDFDDEAVEWITARLLEQE